MIKRKYRGWRCTCCGLIDNDTNIFETCRLCREKTCIKCVESGIPCCDVSAVAHENIVNAILLVIAAFRPRFGRDIATMIGKYVWATRTDCIWWKMSTTNG
jgi:hypothetical protein